jgi:hypothetical protein
MTRQINDASKFVLALTAVLALSTSGSYIADTLGAAFESTLVALLATVLVALAVLSVASCVNAFPASGAVFVTLAFSWPAWWPVLDSIACNGCRSGLLAFVSLRESAASNTVVKLGIEAACIVLAGAFLISARVAPGGVQRLMSRYDATK